MPASAMDGDGETARATAAGARVRFDLRALGASPRVLRAVLSVRVDATAASGAASLHARALLGQWEPGRSDDAPRGFATASATVPAGLRAPLRLDVTALLAESLDRGRLTADFALASDDDLRVSGPWRPDDAPRLELVTP